MKKKVLTYKVRQLERPLTAEEEELYLNTKYKLYGWELFSVNRSRYIFIKEVVKWKKTCTKCNIEKELSEFHKKKTGKYGVNSICKKCKKIYSKQYAKENKEGITNTKKKYYNTNKEEISKQCKKYYINNREKIKQCKKQYYQNNKELITNKKKEYYNTNKDKVITQRKKYREDNKERIALRNKKYRQDNKEKVNLREKKWRSENRDKVNAIKARRRAKKLDQTPTLTQQEKDKIILYYKIANHLSIKRYQWQVDHIQPLSKGGLHHPDNLQVIPAIENLKKGAKLNYKVSEYLIIKL